MEINSEVRAAAAHTARNEGTASPVRPAGQARLAENAVLTGEISDLKPDSVTIATTEGVVTAKLRGGPIEAKIGDMASFSVMYDNLGELTLELKQLPKHLVKIADVSDALTASGFKASPENIKMALELLNNGLPLSKDNLSRMNQALKLMGADKTAEALFMLNNNLKIGPRTAETLEKLISGGAKLLSQLSGLENSISSLTDESLKGSLQKLFKSGDPAGDALMKIESDIKEQPDNLLKIANRIAGALDELEPGDLRKFTKDLAQMLDSVKELKGLGEALSKALNIAGAKELGLSAEPAAESEPQLIQDSANQAVKPDEVSEGKNTIQVKDENQSVKSAVFEILNSKEEFFTSLDRNEGGFSQLKKLIGAGDIKPDNVGDILKFLKIDKSPEELSSNELRYLMDKLTPENAEAKKMSRMKFDPRNSSPADMDKFLTELRESVMTARSELINKPSPESANIMKELADINSNIELTAQLKANLYIQLPIAINNHDTNVELFVFKDGKKKKKSGASTALVALDTANLGRVETYIQKEGSSVNLQFRVKSGEVESTIIYNLDKLNAQLKAHNLNLLSYTFKRLTEEFNLLKHQDALTESPFEDRESDEQNMDGRMLVFDVRL